MEPCIDCSELFMRLGDDEVLVLDCRDLEEWNRFELQIPGALKMSVQEVSQLAHVLPDDELIVVCGCAPDGSDARRASRLLRMRGRMAVTLTGGLRAWIEHGYPTERYERRGVARAPRNEPTPLQLAVAETRR